MSRKDHRDESVSSHAVTMIEKLTFPNLKRECILRGLEFELVGNMSVLKLQSWFLHHWGNPIQKDALNKYDEWVTNELRSRNADPLLYSDAFKLGTIISKDAEGGTHKRRGHNRLTKLREKKARTEDNLYVGTKKAYTFELQKAGVAKSEVIQKVMEKFPEAKEKSIGIWFNKAKRLQQAK